MSKQTFKDDRPARCHHCLPQPPWPDQLQGERVVIDQNQMRDCFDQALKPHLQLASQVSENWKTKIAACPAMKRASRACHQSVKKESSFHCLKPKRRHIRAKAGQMNIKSSGKLNISWCCVSLCLSLSKSEDLSFSATRAVSLEEQIVLYTAGRLP